MNVFLVGFHYKKVGKTDYTNVVNEGCTIARLVCDH